MSTYSSVEFSSIFPIPVKSLEYRDMGVGATSSGELHPGLEDKAAREEAERKKKAADSEADFAERI